MDRKQFLALLGKLPQKAHLNIQAIEEIDCGSFVRKKISFSSEQNEIITAYLCIPKKEKPLPTIYCFHQHGGNHMLGKSEVVGLGGSPDQNYATELAERGFITFAPDAICFEERANKEEPFAYHTYQLDTRLIQGQTLLAKVLFDISYGIDLLESLDEVDNSRIGFIGHSYGGRTALFAPAFDGRIKASVCSCGSTNYKDMLANNTGVQLDFVIPDILRYGDLEDIVKLGDPCNILILGTDDDKWSLSLEHINQYASDSFRGGDLETKTYMGKHQFNNEMREHAYEFLEKYLKK